VGLSLMRIVSKAIFSTPFVSLLWFGVWGCNKPKESNKAGFFIIPVTAGATKKAREFVAWATLLTCEDFPHSVSM
jgi:hypothetical protein